MSRRIILSSNEQQIQTILLNVVNELAAKSNKPPVQLRIAGGWVRDKLMGLESNDIDIAIDTMTGEPFALAVKEYMHQNGFHMSQVSKIQMNPDKSKHLETATARILGLDIDFVNLRSEKYQEDSRNPQIVSKFNKEFGTPLEDALRRDITINSLFYNIHTNEVEDFTGHGLDDLEKKLIRTPMPPLQTLTDDPLRVLRVIRFCTRFGYKLSEDIIDAAKQPSLRVL